MHRDIEPVLLAYLVCGVLLALLQIISIVFSSAYCAALSRRLNITFVFWDSLSQFSVK